MRTQPSAQEGGRCNRKETRTKSRRGLLAPEHECRTLVDHGSRLFSMTELCSATYQTYWTWCCGLQMETFVLLVELTVPWRRSLRLPKRRSNAYQVNIIQKAPEVSQLEEMCVLSAVPLGGVLSSWGDGPQPTDAGVGGLTGERPTWKVTACRSISA